MDEMEMEELRSQRLYAKVQVNKAYRKYSVSNSETINLRTKLDEARDRYEDLDKQLAEVDGRLEVLPATGKKKEKKVEPPVLTIEQIKDIAEKVGIVLDLGEECDLD